MTTPKRQTLAVFLFYSVCGGQAEMGPIGYSALPLNLVTASFAQVGKLKAADSKVDLTNQAPANCDNPTFDKANPSKNRLAEIAPQPPACDKEGAGPCDASGTTALGSGGTGSGGGSGASGGGTGATGATGGSGTGGTGATARNGRATAGASAGASINPDTGQVVGVGSGSGGSGANAVPVDLAGYNASGSPTPFAVLAIALLLVGLVLPPVLALQWRRTRGTSR